MPVSATTTGWAPSTHTVGRCPSQRACVFRVLSSPTDSGHWTWQLPEHPAASQSLFCTSRQPLSVTYQQPLPGGGQCQSPPSFACSASGRGSQNSHVAGHVQFKLSAAVCLGSIASWDLTFHKEHPPRRGNGQQRFPHGPLGAGVRPTHPTAPDAVQRAQHGHLLHPDLQGGVYKLAPRLESSSGHAIIHQGVDLGVTVKEEVGQRQCCAGYLGDGQL